MLLNRERALDAMRRCGVDALVAATPVNVTYFSDYYCWLDPLTKNYMLNPGGDEERALQAYAVLPLEGEPAVIVNAMFAVNAVDSWVIDLHVFGKSLTADAPVSGSQKMQRVLHSLTSPGRSATPVDALVSVLKARGLTGARVGIERAGLSASAWNTLTASFPGVEFKDCSNLIRLIRMVKSEEEIKRLTRANEIGEAAAMESLSVARPGRPVHELVHHFRRRVAELGADFDHFAYGMAGLGIAMETAYTLSAGDVLYIDYGCVFDRYYSDSGTTLALGEPPKHMMDEYEVLDACIDAGAAVLRPGVKSSAVQRVMREVLDNMGVSESFPHGHGLGLEVRDYPVLVPDNGLRIQDECANEPSDLPLESGMFLNLEASVFLPGSGSLQIEKSYLLSPSGSSHVGPPRPPGPLMSQPT